MIKTNQKYYNWINRLIDLVLLFAAYSAAVRFWLFFIEHNPTNIAYHFLAENPLPALIVFALFICVFQYCGLYDSFRFRTVVSELGRLFLALLLSVTFALGLIFFLKIRDFSRGVAIIFTAVSFILLGIKRIVLRAVLHSVRAKGYNQKYVLVVGSGYLAEKYVKSILSSPQFGYQCIGYVGQRINSELGDNLGDYDSLDSVLEAYSPDEIIIALEPDEIGFVNRIINDCEAQGIRTCIIPTYNDYLPACATIDALNDVRLINIRSIPLDVTFNKFIKRSFDIVFSLFVIILLSPVYLFLAAGVKLSSPGPVFFKQNRVGKERKEFLMYKFRSMRVNDRSDTAWSTDKDDRTTAFGAFIRKFSLDELPQFFNVLKGDMSIIGPRPELPFFVQQYRLSIPKYMIKHQVKPGITGWAQVNGYRGDTSIEKRIEYDIWYIENWSVFLDIKIIFMTVFGGMINKEKNLEHILQEQHR